MPRANKEFILNYATNRWKLNQKRNVGPTSDSIRLCAPSSFEEWEDYYYENVRSAQHLDLLGQALFRHIKFDLPGEDRFHPNLLDSITETDCIAYIHKVVVNRTFDGYMKEHGRL